MPEGYITRPFGHKLSEVMKTKKNEPNFQLPGFLKKNTDYLFTDTLLRLFAEKKCRKEDETILKMCILILVHSDVEPGSYLKTQEYRILTTKFKNLGMLQENQQSRMLNRIFRDPESYQEIQDKVFQESWQEIQESRIPTGNSRFSRQSNAGYCNLPGVIKRYRVNTLFYVVYLGYRVSNIDLNVKCFKCNLSL